MRCASELALSIGKWNENRDAEVLSRTYTSKPYQQKDWIQRIHTMIFAKLFFTLLILPVEVKTQPDYSFTCPSEWTDGAVENLRCIIPRAMFNDKPSGGLCDIYTDTVLFKLTVKGGIPSTSCTVAGFDTTCDGSVNADGCGCYDVSGGNIVIDYNVTADEAVHAAVHWECEPQCLDSAGNSVLLPPNTTECYNTVFTAPTMPPTTATTVAPTTSPPDTTSAPPVTSAPGCPICKKDPDCDKPDWICLLFLLLLIPIVILIIILWYFFVHKPKTGDICGTMNAEEGVPKGSPQNQQTSNGTKPADGKGSSQSQQTTNGNRTVDGKGSSQSQQTTNGNRTVDGKGSPQNQQTTNGNRTADGKRSGQRDNKVGTGHVATNGAHNGEKVSKPVQETELTKVQETSSAPSGVEETSLNGTS